MQELIEFLKEMKCITGSGVSNNNTKLSLILGKMDRGTNAENFAELLKKYNQFDNIHLSNNKIQALEMSKIAKAFPYNYSLTDLTIIDNKFGDDGAISLASGLTNNTLTSIALYGTVIGDKGIIALTSTLKNHKALSKAIFHHNLIGNDGAEAIGMLLQDSEALIHLDISYNKLKTRGFVSIADALNNNKSLLHLDLSNNSIRYDFLAQLIKEYFPEGITCYNNLTYLNLNNSGIDVASAVLIVDGLKHNQNLKELYLRYINLGGESDELKHLKASKGISVDKVLKALIEDKPNLTHLTLSYNYIGEIKILPFLKNLSHVKLLAHLDLSRNNLNSDNAVLIAKILANSQTLKYLDLSINNIDELGAMALAKALELNESLNDLNVLDNNINATGLIAIKNAAAKHIALIYCDIRHNIKTIDNSKYSKNKDRKPIFHKGLQVSPPLRYIYDEETEEQIKEGLNNHINSNINRIKKLAVFIQKFINNEEDGLQIILRNKFYKVVNKSFLASDLRKLGVTNIDKTLQKVDELIKHVPFALHDVCKNFIPSKLEDNETHISHLAPQLITYITSFLEEDKWGYKVDKMGEA